MLYALVLVLGSVCIALIIKVCLLKRSARQISEQFAEKLQDDTNTLISISGSDKDMCALAGSINTQLKELRLAHLRYTAGNRELCEAVTNISHDIRTPLTAICGYLDLLKHEEKSEQASEYLTVIAERTDVIRALTEEMLTYSVSVSEQQELLCEDLILNHVLEESISAFYALLTERNIQPEIEICEDAVHRNLNRTALSRIFANVLSNAVKYSDGDLRIVLDESGKVAFSNHTAALDTVSVGKLFQRFYTVESAETSTGLGLAIAKHLTEEMGGSIEVGYADGVLQIALSFPKA